MICSQNHVKNTINRLLLVCLAAFAVVSFNSRAALPDGLYVDHGYTFFEIKSLTPNDGMKFGIEGISGSAGRERDDKGFMLVGHIRLFGIVHDRSSIKLVVKKDGDVVAENRTASKLFEGGLISGTDLRSRVGPITSGTGEYEVEVIYVHGSTDEESLAHTYKIHIEEVQRLRRMKGDVNRPDYTLIGINYIVSRHQEALSSYMSTPDSAYGSEKSFSYMANNMTIYWNFSPTDLNKKISRNGQTEYLRCTVDGKIISLSEDKTQTSEGARRIVERHFDQNALKYRSASARGHEEFLAFFENFTRLPFKEDGMRPGRWECQMLDNGKLIRTFAWSVDKDGRPIPHPEQEKGLTLAPGAILVDTYIPENGSHIDGRLVPEAVSAGGFYGWQWRSDEMKKLAKKVPKVGTPFPVLSAPEFMPAPDTGPSPAEIAREKRQQEAEATAAKRKAESEARQAQMKAEREQRDAEQEARAAEIAAAQKAAYEQAEQQAQATVEEVQKMIGDAQKSMEDAQSQSATSGMFYVLMRLLLSIALLATGLILAGDMLKSKVTQLTRVVDVLTKQAGVVGIITIALAIVYFLIDLVALRPIIGNGLPQVAALLGGFIAAKDILGKQASVQKYEEKLGLLQAQAQNIGLACLVLGVLHLLIGGVPLM